MAQILNPGPLYKVTCTEYERGYGQRPMGEYYFSTEEEAQHFCKEYASGDSECYYRAEYRRVA